MGMRKNWKRYKYKEFWKRFPARSRAAAPAVLPPTGPPPSVSHVHARAKHHLGLPCLHLQSTKGVWRSGTTAIWWNSMGSRNPMHQHRLGANWLESSSAKKGLVVLLVTKLTRTSNGPLQQRQMAGWGRESCLSAQHWRDTAGLLGAVLGSQYRRDMGLLEFVQWRPTKMKVAFEHLSHEESLRELGMLSLEKRRLSGITESQNGRGWKGPLWVI